MLNTNNTLEKRLIDSQNSRVVLHDSEIKFISGAPVASLSQVADNEFVDYAPSIRGVSTIIDVGFIGVFKIIGNRSSGSTS